jgi:Icc-related predicted phosphoesterase
MVKVLGVSDLHGNITGLDSTKRFIDEHNPDVVVVAGDITHFGPPEWAEMFLDSFDHRLLAINGNCDPPGVIDVIRERREKDLTDCSKEIVGLRFLGLGYPSNMDIGSLHGQKIDVLVSHVPPKGCNDAVPNGQHIGDFFLRDFVLKNSPRIVLSGHVHESRGICELAGSVCINPGPVKDGFGAVIEINGEVVARLIETKP